jgi:hypothetical protein
VTGPRLRAKTETGEIYDDPSEDLLFMLFEDVASGDEEFFIVERTSDLTHQTYIQVAGGVDDFIVEYRDGSPERHFGARCGNLRIAHEAVTGWAFDLDGWKDRLQWTQLRF